MRRRLRVVIDARMTDGVSGGVQQWIIGLASALSKLDDGPEEYLFVINEGHGGWLTPYLAGPCRLLAKRDAISAAPRGSPVEQGARRSRGGLSARFRIVRRFRRRLRRRLAERQRVQWLSPIDQLITQAGADVMHFPRQSAFETAVPTIYQPWDLQHLHLPEFFTAEARQSREATYRAFCAQASLIVVATQWVKDDLRAQYGIASERIGVVNPPPVTVAYIPPKPDEARAIAARLGLPARFAFYPAQTWGHKNHERLFEALRQLRARGIEVPLVCSGHPNPRDPAVVDRAGELGLDGQVTFLGFLSPTEIQVVYGSAAMLVFPSLFEGWGLPILESFAEGVPVACSNVTSLPELVGDAALLFEPTDSAAIAAAVERLWLDDALGRELVERGRARLRQFDWHRTALVMRAYYRRVAGRRLDARELALIAAPPAV
jgi:glycosyltransferase involved in cell wall biosynthesis